MAFRVAVVGVSVPDSRVKHGDLRAIGIRRRLGGGAFRSAQPATHFQPPRQCLGGAVKLRSRQKRSGTSELRDQPVQRLGANLCQFARTSAQAKSIGRNGR